LTADTLFRIFGDGRVRLVVTLLLLAALAHQVALAVWHLVPVPQQPNAIQQTRIERSSATTSDGSDFRQQAAAIGRAFLFGKVEQKAAVVEVEEVVETKLNYKLRGIYYSSNQQLSSAIVEIKPNDSQFFRVDDELADNITLAKIEVDHILISRYGKLERLNLQKPEPLKGQARGGGLAAGTGAGQSALLRSYKRRYSSNPMALATRFQAIPVQQDGKNIGFKLKALRGESLLKKLNFEPNDVFTAVNGVSLKNPFEALDALKSLTTASSVSVTFVRNGAEQTLDFRI